MIYKAIESFTDLQDNNFRYSAGDEYPRAGLKVSKTRLDELAGSSNKRGKPVIEAIAEPAPVVVEAEAEAEVEPEEVKKVEAKPTPKKKKVTKNDVAKSE